MKEENFSKKPVVIRDRENLAKFIEEALTTDSTRKANIGDIDQPVQDWIKRLTGETVKHIEVEQSQIRHAVNESHHLLEHDDIQNSVYGINHPQDIKLSNVLFRGSKVIEIRSNINGDIFFIEAIHTKGEGFLNLVTCYRDKKAGRGSTGS
jgi:hypothetical protein